jgi:hypothetical protein
MYFGSFDQQMTDDFIKYHLLNPEEFWTPVPLPSVAANDPLFQNKKENNWSGQPQGLTFQRSIRALENYGYYAELTLIGEKFLQTIGKTNRFTQQFDPFTAEVVELQDGYGPSVLTALEFISRLYGMHISQDKIYWSCLEGEHDSEYTQRWNGSKFSLKTKGENAICSINGKKILSLTKGARIVTDLEGRFIEMIGISSLFKSIELKIDNKHTILLEPNAIYRLNESGEAEKVTPSFLP